MNAYPNRIYVGSKWLPKRKPIAVLIAAVALSIAQQSQATYLGGDGIPNYLDLDSDNDGLSDKDEYRYSAQIGPGAWVNSQGRENDNDGIPGSRDVDDFDSNIACYRYM